MGRVIYKLKTLLVRVYEQESNPATDPEERERCLLWKKIPAWHPSHGRSWRTGPARQISPVAMGPRLRQEIMVGWDRVQNTHGWYTGSGEEREHENNLSIFLSEDRSIKWGCFSKAPSILWTRLSSFNFFHIKPRSGYLK